MRELVSKLNVVPCQTVPTRNLPLTYLAMCISFTQRMKEKPYNCLETKKPGFAWLAAAFLPSCVELEYLVVGGEEKRMVLLSGTTTAFIQDGRGSMHSVCQ